MKGLHLALAVIGLGGPAFAQAPSRNVVVVAIDGLRWQEVFGGADLDYLKGSVKAAVAMKYAAETAEGRRALLMPFLWNVIAKQGQIFGDPAHKSRARFTNGFWFSYPGYSELLSGVADPRVNSNGKTPNPNVTVLEWLNTRPRFAGMVSGFGSWDVLPFILNTRRSGLRVGTGFVPVPRPRTAREREINELARDLPPYLDYGTFDAPFLHAALEDLKIRKPRVLLLVLGEGDEWAHRNRYDLYIDATWRADQFIERIWTTLQSMPEYRGNTTLLVTTDHGRGATVKDWSVHGRSTPAAHNTWIAALGPGAPALGHRKALSVTASQVAATIAVLVGEDFRVAVPKAAPPLPLR